MPTNPNVTSDEAPVVKEWKENTGHKKTVINEKDMRRKRKMELEKSVQLKTFVIGVGNAGNQTVAIAKKRGMDVFAVNSSVKDLSDSVMDDDIPSFIIGSEARGSGKNIEKGKILFKENGRKLFELDQFINKCQDADIIIVVAATGGGTGPAVAPEICKVLKKLFDKKIVIFHGIMPKNNESNIAFSNTTYCANEIKKLNIPYMITDLEKFSNEPNDIAFVKADNHVVDTLEIISGGLLTISSSQMIDENDLRSVISEPGYLAAYAVREITSTDLESKSIQSMMIDEIKNGAGMMIQKDGIAIQMASIVNMPSDIHEITKTGDYTELFNFLGHRPKNGVYENYATTDGTRGEFAIILSGLTYPINRMNEYMQIIKDQEEFIKRTKDIDVSGDAEMAQSLISNSTDALSDNTRVSEEQLTSALDDLFD